VDQDVVVIGGSAEVNGAINGRLVVVLGSQKRSDAQITRRRRDRRPFEQDDTAMINGERSWSAPTTRCPTLPG
jgi:hypothetical protein